jgi:hypothetical protein
MKIKLKMTSFVKTTGDRESDLRGHEEYLKSWLFNDRIAIDSL